MYTRYLFTALVTLSTTLAAPRGQSDKVKGDYLPISITSPIPSSVGAGETIALSWTGGGGVYDLKFDSSAPGDRYAPQDLMLSTTETTFEYTVTDGQRIAFAVFDVEQFESGEPAPGSWVNTGYISILA